MHAQYPSYQPLIVAAPTLARWVSEVFSRAEIGAAFGVAFGKKFKENQS